ncbi:MAG TPA: hypothetical protein VNT22_06735 [Baekduia sp.]|nr:hypothetical protein [Baekduia sp.]
MLKRLTSPALDTGEPSPALELNIAGLRIAPWVAMVVGCVALAALSLLLPSAPTYDGWAWLIWGREIAHLDLSTTLGPSWKPLPVMFTTVFSIFGDAAPYLWIVVARAGALLALIFAFRVALKLGGGVAGGVGAVAAFLIAPWWLLHAALANSEALMVALVLAAIDSHLEGRRRLAFGLGVATALLRPEAWVFLAVYGLWLAWRRELKLTVLFGSGAMVLALWVLPEWWGSGDWLRAAHSAQTPVPGSARLADDPFLEVFRRASTMVAVPLMVGFVLLAARLVAERRNFRSGIALRSVWLLAAALAWVGLVGVMSAKGDFSGNNRYLMLPLVLGGVVAAASAGWWLRKLRVPNAIAAVVLGIAFVAPWVDDVKPVTDRVDYQAKLTGGLPELVADAGGAEALRRCGNLSTGAYLVPSVAWTTGVHIEQVSIEPKAPAVVFRVRVNAVEGADPPLTALGGARTQDLAVSPPQWRVLTTCPELWRK